MSDSKPFTLKLAERDWWLPRRTRYPYVFTLTMNPEFRPSIASRPNRSRHDWWRVLRREIGAWCEGQFGHSDPSIRNDGRPDWRWHFEYGASLRIHFRYEADAFAFKMRWG